MQKYVYLQVIPSEVCWKKFGYLLFFLSLSDGFTDEDTALSTSQIKILLKLMGTGNIGVRFIKLRLSFYPCRLNRFGTK